MIDKFKLLNRTTNKEVNFCVDGTTSFLIADKGLDLGSADAKHNNYKALSQVGIEITSTNLNQRTISLTGYIWKNIQGMSFQDEDTKRDFLLSEIKKSKEELNAVANPLQYSRFVFDSYFIDGKPNNSVMYSNDYLENNEIKVKFTVSFTCPIPMFMKELSLAGGVTNIIPKFHFPLSIPKSKGMVFGIKKKNRLTTVNNKSDITVGGKFVIKANGRVLNPVIVDVLGNRSMKINKELLAGEEVEIDTRNGTQIVQGRKSLNDDFIQYFEYWEYSNDWIDFVVGESIISFTADSSTEQNMELEIYTQEMKYNLEDE